jgi:hypothetical protein
VRLPDKNRGINMPAVCGRGEGARLGAESVTICGAAFGRAAWKTELRPPDTGVSVAAPCSGDEDLIRFGPPTTMPRGSSPTCSVW